MDNETEERYVFWRFSTSDIDECVKTLELLDSTSCNKTRLALIKASIIAYGRPFSANESVYKIRKNKNEPWRLDASLIPNELKETHELILTYRNKIVAHSDIPHRDPKLGKFGKHFVISSTGIHYEQYLELVSPFKGLASELLKRLWASIKEYESKHF